MAGSPVCGKGYHDGKHDARVEDLIIADIVGVLAAVIFGGVWLYGKARHAPAARLEQRMQDVDDTEDPDSQ